MTNDNLQALSDAGVSIWLDDLSRDRLDSGNLAELVKVRNVVGVTTNPSIFQAALSKGTAYDDAAREAGRGRQERRGGRLRADHRRRPQRLRRHDAGLRRHRRRGRPRVDRGRPAARPRHRRRPSPRPSSCSPPSTASNVLIKIPATLEGLPAITAVHRRGHQRQRHPDLQPRALPRRDERLPQRARAGARRRGKDLSKIESVASFFVSRVDTEIDKRLDAIGTDEAKALKGKAGDRERPAGVPGVRGGLLDPALEVPRGRGCPARSARCGRRRESRTPPTRTRCTSSTSSPRASSTPCRRRRSTRSPTTARSSATPITPNYADAQKVLDDLEAIGVSYNDVVQVLEIEGVEKFEKSWDELLAEATEDLEKAAQKAAQR